MFSFKRTQRLVTKNDYDRVFEQAKKIVTSEFTLLFRENYLGYARLGIALSKKMIAKAHDRNRIKRLLREKFRRKKLPAVDVIFLARHAVVKQTKADINAGLDKIWDKLISFYDK